MSDQIEKSIDIAAPVDRVWRALVDHAQFGTWFRVKLDAPFVVGEVSRGHITYPGYEHLVWEAKVVEITPPSRFVFTWHPFAIDPDTDYSAETPTTVTFTLAPVGEGTRVTVVESGFDAIPANRRDEALRSNTGGWEEQMKNIKAHVEG